MSQMRDNILLLKEMLRKYSDTPLPVINTFYEMVSNEEG